MAQPNIPQLIRDTVAGSKYRFKDSNTGKSKLVHNVHTDDDIVITLPDDSGVIVTTNTLVDILNDTSTDEGIRFKYILKPDITENNGGITDPIGHSKPILAASYRTSEAFTGPHETTEWEISLTPSFSNVVLRESNPANKKAWRILYRGLNQTIYIRYRFVSGSIKSQWSDNLSIVTPSYSIDDFIVTVTNEITPTIRPSGFVAHVTGGHRVNLKSTEYRIIDTTNNSTAVHVNPAGLPASRSYKVGEGLLRPNRRYKVYVKYHTDNANIPESREMSTAFTTPSVYISKPTITYKFENGQMYLVGSPYTMFNTGDNQPDPHIASDWHIVLTNNQNHSIRFTRTIHVNNETNVKETETATMLNITGYVRNVYWNSGNMNIDVKLSYRSKYYQSEITHSIFNVSEANTIPLNLNVGIVNKQIAFLLDKDPKLTLEGDGHFSYKIEDPVTDETRVKSLVQVTFPNTSHNRSRSNPYVVNFPNEFVRRWNKQSDRFTSKAHPRRIYNLEYYLIGDKFNSDSIKYDWEFPVHFESNFSHTQSIAGNTIRVDVKHTGYKQWPNPLDIHFRSLRYRNVRYEWLVTTREYAEDNTFIEYPDHTLAVKSFNITNTMIQNIPARALTNLPYNYRHPHHVNSASYPNKRWVYKYELDITTATDVGSVWLGRHLVKNF